MVIVASADVPNWHANLRYLELLMVADSYKQQVMYEGFFPFCSHLTFCGQVLLGVTERSGAAANVPRPAAERRAATPAAAAAATAGARGIGENTGGRVSL